MPPLLRLYGRNILMVTDECRQTGHPVARVVVNYSINNYTTDASMEINAARKLFCENVRQIRFVLGIPMDKFSLI